MPPSPPFFFFLHIWRERKGHTSSNFESCVFTDRDKESRSACVPEAITLLSLSSRLPSRQRPASICLNLSSLSRVQQVNEHSHFPALTAAHRWARQQVIPSKFGRGKKKEKKKNGRKGCREGEILLRSLGQIMQDKRAAASG